MKKVLLFLAAIALIGCNNSTNDPEQYEDVQFHILDLEVSQESFAPARKSVTPSAAELTDIWIIEGESTLAHQVSSDDNFGTLSVRLKYGQHTLTFIASGKEGQTVTEGVWSADYISDTYGCVRTLTVQTGMATQSIELTRANYAIRWQSTDEVPTGAAKIEVSINNHRKTLEAKLMGGAAELYTFSFSATKYVGEVLPEFYVSGFCGAYGVEEEITTTFKAKDASGNVLYSHSKTVPVITKCKTIIKGELFCVPTPSAVSVNQEWLTDNNVTL